jgi:hypothetical protein
MKNLKRNFYLYSLLQSRCLQINDIEKKIECIEDLARFARVNHPGIFYDDRIEKQLNDIGRNIIIDDDFVKNLPDGYSNYDSLYVATRLEGAGGHTKCLIEFCRYAQGVSCLVLTSQHVEDLPTHIAEKVHPLTKVISLAHYQTAIEKAKALRVLASRVKRVHLYHTHNDALPSIALASKNLPPVVLQNHEHSWFWLGLSIADLVLSYTHFHDSYTVKYREVKSQRYFDVILFDKVTPAQRDQKIKAKKALGIDEQTTLITSIGSRGKFKPNDKYNFFEIAYRIVAHRKDVLIYVIGIDDKDELVPVHVRQHPQIKCLGYKTNVIDYFLASDISLESMPEASLGVQILAPYAGLSCPFPKPDPQSILSSSRIIEDSSYHLFFNEMDSLNLFYEKMNVLINDKDLRMEIAQNVQNEFVKKFDESKFRQNIQDLHEELSTMKHEVRSLQQATFHADAWNIELAKYSVLKHLLSFSIAYAPFLRVTDFCKLFIFSLREGTLGKEVSNIFTILKSKWET